MLTYLTPLLDNRLMRSLILAEVSLTDLTLENAAGPLSEVLGQNVWVPARFFGDEWASQMFPSDWETKHIDGVIVGHVRGVPEKWKVFFCIDGTEYAWEEDRVLQFARVHEHMRAGLDAWKREQARIFGEQTARIDPSLPKLRLLAPHSAGVRVHMLLITMTVGHRYRQCIL